MRAIAALHTIPYLRRIFGGRMRFEVVEALSEWIVRRDGRELARFPNQEAALQDVAQRLRTANADAPSGLSVRYERKHRAG